MTRFRIFLLAIAAVLLMQSCSKNDRPSVEIVPATADYVALVNADSLLETTESLLPGRGDKDMGRLTASCNLSNILIYKPTDSRQPFAVAAVTDKEKLTSLLADMGWQRRNSDGEETYSPEAGGEFAPCVVIDGNMAWFLGTRGDLKNRRESLTQAGKENFGKYNLDFNIDGTTRLAAYISPVFLGFAEPETMVKLTGALNADRTATFKAEIVSTADGKTGKNIPITALAPITDTRFTGCLPASNSLIAAAGIKKGINWNGLVDLLGSGLGTQNQGMLQTLLPYMASLNGPFAIGLGPFTAQSLMSDELESQAIVVYATMEDSKASAAVDEINGNLREKGLSPRPRPDGVYAFDLNGVKYRYTATDDGVFIFAINREIESSQRPDSTLFTSRQAYAEIQLPPVSALVPGCGSNLSLTATLVMNTEGLTLKMKSSDMNPIVAFSRWFHSLEDAVRDAEEASPDYYDDY